MRIAQGDLSVITEYLLRGAEDPSIGYEDITYTYEKMLSELTNRKPANGFVQIPMDLVESCLWSALLAWENGKWKEPEPFEQFINRLTPPGHKYNFKFSMFEENG